MKIIGILGAIACLTMGNAAHAACSTPADAYQDFQRQARVLDTTPDPEQLEMMQIAGLIVRAAAGFKTAEEELICRGWSQRQIDDAVHRMAAQRAISQ